MPDSGTSLTEGIVIRGLPCESVSLGERSVEEHRHELNRLMLEHIESLEDSGFLGRVDEEEYRQHEERLKRIREVSADYLAALKRLR